MGYRFNGETVKLKGNHYQQWEKEFSYIDLYEELKKCDAYYTNNPPKEGKWWFPVRQWLKNQNAYQKKRRLNEGGPKEVYGSLIYGG